MSLTVPSTSLTSLELFAGAGGLALGIHQAGFEHMALIEWDSFAVQTLRENSLRLLKLDPDLIFPCDARLVDYTCYRGKVDLLAGGPPCQPFSTGGLNNGHSDDRNMFPHFLDTMAAIMPRAVLIENVRGLSRQKFHHYFGYVLKRLSFPLHRKRDDEKWHDHYQRLLLVKESDFQDREQYVVHYQLLDTADYGIPQRRERVIITAYRRDLSIDPLDLKPTHAKESLLVDQWITGEYWQRHKVEPYDFLGPRDRLILAKLRDRLPLRDKRQPWITVRDKLARLPEPVPRGAKEVMPNHVQHPGARAYPGHTGSFYDYPAKALKAGNHGTPGGENMLRTPPGDGVRYFTTREAARLHTFPDDWRFHGSWGACIRQLGNAVPVELAKRFGEEIHKHLVRTTSL